MLDDQGQDIFDDIVNKIDKYRKDLSKKERDIFDMVVKDIEDYKSIVTLRNLKDGELDVFFEKKENITPTIQKILDLENSGYLTRDDTLEIFCGAFILDDSINIIPLPTEENILRIINVVLKRFSKEEQEEILRKLMVPTALYPKECREILIKYKYFDEN